MPGSWRWRSTSAHPAFAAGLLICLLVGPLLPAAAQPWAPGAPPGPADLGASIDPGPAAGHAIDQAILSQWQAIRASDAAGGFAFASPRLREMYGTPDQFFAMVEAGYRPVLQAERLEFLRFVEFRGYLTREVRLTEPSGGSQDALYMMTRLADGSWRIAGCVLMAPATQS